MSKVNAARSRKTIRVSRTGCAEEAVASLSYHYARSAAWLDRLAEEREPHAYDLCDLHSERLSAPRGWEVLRLAAEAAGGPSSDDLLALADAVREAGREASVPVPPAQSLDGVRRGHLRVLRPEE